MKKRVAVIWHQHMEEIEGITPVDLLRRAEIEVETFSADNQLTVVGSHKIKLMAEKKLEDLKVDSYDALVLIGGPGVDTLLNNDNLIKLTQEFHSFNKVIGAICAAPQILGRAGIAQKINLTHYPGSNQFLSEAHDLAPQSLVIHNNIITSAGPGTAFEYALALIEILKGKAVAQRVRQETVYHS